MRAPDNYTVRSFSLRMLIENNYSLNLSISEERTYYIRQADCAYFRLIRKITNNCSHFIPNIVFVDIDTKKDIGVVISNLAINGIKIRGQKFVLAERSASMVRQGILSFVDAHIAPELEERVRMGLDIGTTVLSKWYAYRGLMLSSAHCLEDFLPKIIVVPDCKLTIKDQHIRFIRDEEKQFTIDDGKVINWKQKGVASGVRDITIDAFDGTGLMSFNVAHQIEDIIGCERGSVTSCILRAPFIKGLVHAMPYQEFFKERGIEYIEDVWHKWHSSQDDMIILTESMYKGIKYFKQNGDSTDWDRYWELFEKYGHCISIARSNFTEEQEAVYTRNNYQVLDTLTLPYEKFRTLADESISWVDKIIRGDELYTKCFLGIVDGKCNPKNDYVASIAKNYKMMNEPSVRKYFISLVSRYMDDMCAGKLYIKSCFKFLAPDLIALMEHIGQLPVNGCLALDEFWSRRKGGYHDGEYLITRNPHICKSENVILNIKKSEEIERWCGHLQNVCMINIRSITPQRLNGAD